MPVIFKQKAADFVLAVWEISESEKELLQSCKLSRNDHAKLELIKPYKKRLQWLCVRVLLQKTSEKKHQIFYDQNGNPQLIGSDKKISISHSGEMVALILHENKEVGVDIQRINDKVERIKHKFMGEKELNFAMKSFFPLKVLTVCWGVKEAIFKIFGVGVVFKDIEIEPFNLSQDGRLFASYNGQRFNVQYLEMNDYFLVYVTE